MTVEPPVARTFGWALCVGVLGALDFLLLFTWLDHLTAPAGVPTALDDGPVPPAVAGIVSLLGLIVLAALWILPTRGSTPRTWLVSTLLVLAPAALLAAVTLFGLV